MDSNLHYSLYSRSCIRYIKQMIRPDASHILDIGFGAGYILRRIKEKLCHSRFYGVELDFNSVKNIKDSFCGYFVNANGEHLPYKDNSFDLVLCIAVLEHIEDDKGLLSEANRCLMPNGELILAVPCTSGVFGRTELRDLGHKDRNSLEYHFRNGYTFQEISKFLAETNFKIINYKYSLVFLSERIFGLSKYMYLKKNKLNRQVDIEHMKSSLLFNIYKAFFPFLLFIEYIESTFFSKFLKGHILIIRARKNHPIKNSIEPGRKVVKENNTVRSFVVNYSQRKSDVKAIDGFVIYEISPVK